MKSNFKKRPQHKAVKKSHKLNIKKKDWMEKAEKDGLWSCKNKKGWINTSILDKRDIRETRGKKDHYR